MPQEIGPGDLLEHASGWLENNRIGECNHPACGLRISWTTELHDVNADQADIHNFTRHTCDLHAIANPDAVLSNQEKVGDHGDNHVLQGDGNAGGEQSGKGDGRAQITTRRSNRN